MASYKLNLATIRGLPAPREIVQAMTRFGLPEAEEFGVLNCSATEQAAFATIVRKTQQAMQKLDADTKEVTSAPIERVTIYSLAVLPQSERLEVYTGAASGIEQMGIFFSSCLAMPTVTEAVELDIPAAIAKLEKATQKFQLRSVRVSDFAHNSYMSGIYAPKFLDSQHGLEFVEEYAEALASAAVRFAGPTGRVNVTLAPKACFRYSCNEDDVPTVQTILRKIV